MCYENIFIGHGIYYPLPGESERLTVVRFQKQTTEESPPSQAAIRLKHGWPGQSGVLRGMARAQKRHSPVGAMMELFLSYDDRDMMRRRLPSGASPNLVGR